MSVRRQLGPGLILFVALGSLLALPGTASAAPAAPAAPVPDAYPPPAPTMSVSTTTPTVGTMLGISFTGFRPFERASVDLVPAFRHLGTFRANASGSGFGSVRIPGGVRGSQVLVLSGLHSGRVASAVIDVLGPGTTQGGQAGGGAGGTGNGGTSGNAGRAGGGGSGGINGSQSAGAGSGGLASTGFSAFEYARIAGGLILAGGALALIGRRARRRGKAKAAA